jgi:hypothetical protein
MAEFESPFSDRAARMLNNRVLLSRTTQRNRESWGCKHRRHQALRKRARLLSTMVDDPERVYLTGAREGAYLVTAEQADGSLLLKPDNSVQARRRPPLRERDEDAGLLLHLVRRRPEPALTTTDALEAWGVELHDDEAVVEFVVADVDKRRGFLAVTNRRLIFVEEDRAGLWARYEHPISQIASVEPLARGRRAKLTVNFEGAPSMIINTPSRSQLERLRAALSAR